MKKEKLNVNIEETAVSKSTNTKKVDDKKNVKKIDKKKSDKPSFFARIGKFFKGMLSELKKVKWPPFTKQKDNTGVISQTGVVLMVVVFFLVVLTAFDSGLLALLKLLTKG